MKRCTVCQRTFDDAAAFCVVDASPLVSDDGATSMVGRIIDRKYRIERLLGEGGMGSVYEAVHVEIGRRVALKLMNPALLRDPASLERFRREARAAGRLEHPNAVTIHDFGVDSTGEAYLVMELLDGTSFRELLKQRGRFSLGEVTELLAPAAAAVDAAHASGIVHRDLKPDNIMLARRSGESVVKVLDFGIAKLANSGADGGTLTGTGVIGTPYYMSPEQGEGAALGPASDVYSLGIVAFEMLTGRVPFRGDTPISTLVKHVNTPPPRPSSVLPELDPRVDDAVLWALAKSPSERPRTATEFINALRKVVDLHVGSTVALPGGHAGTGPTSPIARETRGAGVQTHPDTTPATVRPAFDARLEDVAPRRSSLPLMITALGLGLLLVLVAVGGVAYVFREDLGLVARKPVPPTEPLRTPTPSTTTPEYTPPLRPDGPAETPKLETAPVPVPAVSASSVRESQGGNVFTPAKAIDGRKDTAWCEGADGPGLGESLTLKFDKPIRVATLKILPGYFKSGDRWSQNNRIAEAHLILSDNRVVKVAFEDEMLERDISIGGDPIESITIVIDKVYVGGDGLDTLISEIAIDAR